MTLLIVLVALSFVSLMIAVITDSGFFRLLSGIFLTGAVIFFVILVGIFV